MSHILKNVLVGLRPPTGVSQATATVFAAHASQDGAAEPLHQAMSLFLNSATKARSSVSRSNSHEQDRKPGQKTSSTSSHDLDTDATSRTELMSSQ